MNEKDLLIRRYRTAIARIGGAPALLSLPERVKDALKNTNDLRTKVKMLELIAHEKNGQ